MWNKASPAQINNFQTHLSNQIDILLQKFPLDLLTCAGCTKHQHTETVDNLSQKLHSILLLCEKRNIPRSRQSNSKPKVAGWNEQCATLYEQSLKWHQIWVQMEHPLTIYLLT